VFRESRGVAALFASSLLPGVQEVTWNGLRASGPVRDGSYVALVEARDALGTASFAAPFVLDTAAPRTQVVSGRPLRVRVSEPASLVVRVNGTTVRRQVPKAGVVRVPWDSTPRRVRVVAPPRGPASPRE
jgi:hypothetical protein